MPHTTSAAATTGLSQRRASGGRSGVGAAVGSGATPDRGSASLPASPPPTLAGRSRTKGWATGTVPAIWSQKNQAKPVPTVSTRTTR